MLPLPSPLRRALRRLGFPEEWYLIIIGAVVGTLTGLAAIAFDWLLHRAFDSAHSIEARLGPVGLVVLPTVGLAATGVLVHYFAADAKGHGVPQVMRALITRGGFLPWRTGIVKAATSILTVGSGGSAGTEGPIVQIGATAGSVVGQRLGVSREQMSVLVGCGAAAGISSIFNAPIAGVIFVLEVLLRDFSLRAFTPIVVASVFSAVTTQAVLGENEAIFTVEETLHALEFTPQELPSYVLLGGICGLVAVAFQRLLHKGEDLYDAWRIHPLLKPVTGGLALGALALAYVALEHALGTGSLTRGPAPAFFANGYEPIHRMLAPDTYLGAEGADARLAVLALLLLLMLFKAVATTFTLACGGSGGVFAPSLFLGATAGGALGLALELLHLIPEGSTPASYALVGMAAVLAASSHAPLTAILLLFELTRNIYVMLPVMLAAVLATVVAQLLDRDSIYTFRLRRSGLRVGRSRDLTVLRRVHVRSVKQTPLPPEPVYPSDPVAKLVAMHAVYDTPDFPVVDERGRYVGMVTGLDVRTALIDREAIPLLLVAELMRSDPPTVLPDDTLDAALDKFAAQDSASIVVIDSAESLRPVALITRADVMERYRGALDEH
ncbi:MAG: chloride channel protein [Phycisphaeraceae bacterium]|nr:chloride channel protein [Phycisphaeraceae bacterium]